MSSLYALVITAILLISPAMAGAEALVVWGSTTCQKRFLEPGAEGLKKTTGIDLTVQGVGTGQGLLALIDGKTAVSAASESLDDAVGSARKVAAEQKRSFEAPQNLQFHEITQDTVVPTVHRDNPVTKLTWAQLRDINSGKISNWRDVGGSDLPIKVVTSHAGSATRAFFEKTVMQGEAYVATALIVDTTKKEILEISENVGAIGAVSMTFLKLYSGKTKPILSERITRPLGLITIGAPTPVVQKVINYFLSPEGKQYLR